MQAAAARRGVRSNAAKPLLCGAPGALRLRLLTSDGFGQPESVAFIKLLVLAPKNAEVSDGGGHQALESANECRPPPFARPKS